MWIPLFSFDDEILDPSLLQPSPILVGMATCHSLTVIDNCIAGDPLDVIMFNSLNWVNSIFYFYEIKVQLLICL